MFKTAQENSSWTHTKFWVFNRNPGAVNDQQIYFKNYAVQKYSSDLSPNVYTTAAPTEAPSTTHPITTTTSTAGKLDFLAKWYLICFFYINSKFSFKHHGMIKPMG